VICGSVADEFTAQAAGLERQWIIQIPSGVGSWRLERVTVGDGLVVAQTGDGGVHAIQAARGADELPPGTLLWSQRIGTPGGPSGPAGIGPHVVTVARDLGIDAIDRRTGAVAWTKEFGQLPGAAAVPAGDWVYAAVPNEGVLRLPVNPWRSAASPTPAGQAKSAAARGKQAATTASFVESLEPKTVNAGGEVAFSPVPLADGVAWSTTDGTVIALERTKQGWLRHELPLEAPLAGPPVVRGRTLFAATGPYGAPWPATLARIELADPAAPKAAHSSRATGSCCRWVRAASRRSPPSTASSCGDPTSWASSSLPAETASGASTRPAGSPASTSPRASAAPASASPA
jgi:hypothetical protein